MIALADAMKLDVTAVGVESAGQQAILEAHGCRRMQGYRFGPPMAAAEIEALLLSRQADVAA